jgi:hypothetical protein
MHRAIVQRAQEPVRQHSIASLTFSDKISVISGIDVSLSVNSWASSIDSASTTSVGRGMRVPSRFMAPAWSRDRGPAIALLDNSGARYGVDRRTSTPTPPSSHRALAVLCARTQPELNPDEGAWRLAKRELSKRLLSRRPGVDERLHRLHRPHPQITGETSRVHRTVRAPFLGADHCTTYAVFYNVNVSCAFILPSSSSRTQLCKNIH